MKTVELKKAFSELNIWKRGGERAPHKPLLLLYSLGRVDRNERRLISYEETKRDLRELLTEFGPLRPPMTNHPFVRLQNDGIWEVIGQKVLDSSVSWGDRILIENKSYGGFTEEVYSTLIKDKDLLREIAGIILERNFPDTIHTDILEAIGLNLETIVKPRDANFRERILQAYEYSCAVCGFNVRLGHTLFAVEAAHIKWHQAGGPDVENNGIALCTLHHKLFDRGVFAINPAMELKVAERAHGTQGFEEWLMRYHGNTIRGPQRTQYQPAELYLNWHIREVFRGTARESFNY